MDSVVYAGTERGMFTLRQERGDAPQVAGRALGEWEVTAVAVDPSAPNRVLAATRGDGVWLSEDRGEHWKKPCYGKPGPGKVRSLALDPSTPGRVYAGCEPIDLFVSDDLGQNWQRLDSVWEVPHVATVSYPSPRSEPHIRHVAVDPTDPATMYLALQVGYILKTTDEGETWTVLKRDIDCDVHTLVIDPRNPRRVVAATGGGDSRKGQTRGRSLYLSEDGGESWGGVAMQFDQEYSVPLAMNPVNPDILYAPLAHGNPSRWDRPEGADSVVIRSKDGGHHWERLESGLSATTRVYAETFAFDPTRPARVFAGFTSGEMFVSEDAGDSWSRALGDLPGITALAVAPD